MVGQPSGYSHFDAVDGIDELAAWLLDKASADYGDSFAAHLTEIRRLAQELARIVDGGKDLPERDQPRQASMMARIRYTAKVVDPC